MHTRAPALVILCGSAACLASDVTLHVDPRAAYLHTNSDSGSLTAPAIPLATLQIAPGDVVRFTRTGGFRYVSGGQEDTASSMIAVFSSSATILAASNLNRVPGAIDAGVDFTTAATYHGAQPTDIPQDFRIAGTGQPSSCVVTVPAGATHMFITAYDSLYGDNADADNDFTVTASVLCPADFNNDGFVDFFDLDAYLSCFEGAVCPEGRTADFNADGFPDFFDLDAYIEAFEAGC